MPLWKRTRWSPKAWCRMISKFFFFFLSEKSHHSNDIYTKATLWKEDHDIPLFAWKNRKGKNACLWDFPGGSVVKNLPTNAGDKGSILGPRRSHMPGATKPVCHNFWSCVLEPGSHSYWACMPHLLQPLCPRACVLQQGKPLQWGTCTLQLESSLSSLPTTRGSLHSAAKIQCCQK